MQSKNLRNYFSVSYWFNCLNELQSKRWPTWCIPVSPQQMKQCQQRGQRAVLLKFVINRKLVFIWEKKSICSWNERIVAFFLFEFQNEWNIKTKGTLLNLMNKNTLRICNLVVLMFVIVAFFSHEKQKNICFNKLWWTSQF